MWIEIESDIFDNADFSALNNLISHLVYNPIDSIFRYNVLVNLPLVETKSLFKKLPQHLQETLTQEYNVYGLISPKVKYCVSETARQSGKFNIEEALRVFKEPLVILLENSKNDAHFIECIASYFGKKNSGGLNRIEEHIANGWIAFDNAGGCTNVKNVIDGKLAAYNRLALKYGRNNYEYYRAFVLLDSDREYPLQTIKSQYTKLLEHLSDIEVCGVHILEKRMMENYMPDEIFEDIQIENLQPWISVYKILSQDQKDYLAYKDGFSKDFESNGNRKPLHPEIVNLYNISKKNIEILDNGFNYPHFKTNFPQLFKSTRVNKHTLKSRANSTELEVLVAKIEELI